MVSTDFQVDLDDTMDNFFNTLYQKMFTVLNSQYNFDNKYMECVGEHMKEIRPFGDAPQKLGVQIKRSFVATRAFSQALTVAADVLKNMQSVNIARVNTQSFTFSNYGSVLENCGFAVEAIDGVCSRAHEDDRLPFVQRDRRQRVGVRRHVCQRDEGLPCSACGSGH